MEGDRERQQKRHVEGSVETILRQEVAGETALDIENLCKSLDEERISAPVVAYGIGTNTEIAVKAINTTRRSSLPFFLVIS